MADISEKASNNAPGKYYVTEECIDCNLCCDTAPANFSRDDDEGRSYVKQQPEDAAQEEACAEAMDSCPVSAIGDDGE